jgi:hypothetical protein
VWVCRVSSNGFIRRGSAREERALAPSDRHHDVLLLQRARGTIELAVLRGLQ